MLNISFQLETHHQWAMQTVVGVDFYHTIDIVGDGISGLKGNFYTQNR